MKRLFLLTMMAWTTVAFCGCGEQAQTSKEPAGEPKSDAPAEPPGDRPQHGPHAKKRSTITTAEQLQAALKQKNPDFDGEVKVAGDGQIITAVEAHHPAIEDISPLDGLPLMHLDLTGCRVADISVLNGTPLCVLYLGETGVQDISVLKGIRTLMHVHLNETKVDDLSPLKGAENLQQLNLIGSRVSDLGPLRGMPGLQTLWLTGCPVSDIGPLAEVPSLVSLTIARTKVSDLGPLRGTRLQRLHIAESEVTDLSPVKEMPLLKRLVFTPGKIEKGIEHVWELGPSTQLGTHFDAESNDLDSRESFKTRWELGEFK